MPDLKKNAVIRRRPSPEQGRGLEILGHAIEYLMDSYVLIASATGNKADQEAIQIIMRLNREVFAECPEIVPLRNRLWASTLRWLTWMKALLVSE